jgi:hypothetical protein
LLLTIRSPAKHQIVPLVTLFDSLEFPESIAINYCARSHFTMPRPAGALAFTMPRPPSTLAFTMPRPPSALAFTMVADSLC